MSAVRNTVEFRLRRARELARWFDIWIKMPDGELFAEVQKVFPACTEASRDQCFKFLAMSAVYDMVPNMVPG